MQNFMKTILSAVQTWTKGKIKESTADWNQNDASADSYVKNRTHWEEKDGTVHKLDSKYLDLPTNIATTDDIQDVVDYVQDAKQEAIDAANNAQSTADTAVANAATLQSNLSTTNTNVTKLQSDVANIKADAIAAKDYIIMNDISNGRAYKIQMQNGNIISSVAGVLQDFTYATYSEGEITITGWNQTYCGEPSTEMIVPDGVRL